MTDNNEVDNQSRDAPVERIEHYKIIKMLGHGAMGEVSLAEDPRAGNRKVAIKTIARFDSASADKSQALRERLVEEAKALGQINHPGVPALHHVIDDESAVYVVMEYVEGCSLAELLRQGRTPTQKEAVRIAVSVLDALTAVHKCGLVHRDVKPSNIVLAPGGTVKLIDFGLAKCAEVAPQLTRTNVTPGTRGYISPEQLQGKEAGPASDQFCAGVVLYELITGKRPFDGKTDTDVQFKILYEAPPDIGRLKSDVPEPLQAIIMRSLAKDPSERFETAEAMMQALQMTKPAGARHPSAAASSPSDGSRTSSVRTTGRVRKVALAGGILAASAVGLFLLLPEALLGSQRKPVQTPGIVGAPISKQGDTTPDRQTSPSDTPAKPEGPDKAPYEKEIEEEPKAGGNTDNEDPPEPDEKNSPEPVEKTKTDSPPPPPPEPVLTVKLATKLKDNKDAAALKASVDQKLRNGFANFSHGKSLVLTVTSVEVGESLVPMFGPHGDHWTYTWSINYEARWGEEYLGEHRAMEKDKSNSAEKHKAKEEGLNECVKLIAEQVKGLIEGKEQ